MTFGTGLSPDAVRATTSFNFYDAATYDTHTNAERIDIDSPRPMIYPAAMWTGFRPDSS